MLLLRPGVNYGTQVPVLPINARNPPPPFDARLHSRSTDAKPWKSSASSYHSSTSRRDPTSKLLTVSPQTQPFHVTAPCSPYISRRPCIISIPFAHFTTIYVDIGRPLASPPWQRAQLQPASSIQQALQPFEICSRTRVPPHAIPSMNLIYFNLSPVIGLHLRSTESH